MTSRAITGWSWLLSALGTLILWFMLSSSFSGSLHAGEFPLGNDDPASSPQAHFYAPVITNIRFSSSPVYAGWATIYVDVRNDSTPNGPEDGAATFRVLLEIDPPGDDNDYKDPFDLGTKYFTKHGAIQTYSMRYEFKETGLYRRYRFKAKVYDPQKTHEFTEYPTSGTEDISVEAVKYNASVDRLEVSSSSLRQGDTATISARFTNGVISNSGEGTFDIAFLVQPPTGSAQELEFTDSDRVFTNSQSKTLGKEYKFEQWGTYAIKARIWNPDRSDMFDESEIQLEVGHPYGAEVMDIRFSSSPVYAGWATIYVDVRNDSTPNGPEDGAATFRVLLEIDPPGDDNDYKDPFDLGTKYFTKHGAIQTYSMRYEFKETGLYRRYRFKAKVYDPQKTHEFTEYPTSGTEDISVEAVKYNASVDRLEVSSSSLRQGDTATISARFTNGVISNSGEGTFDIAFLVQPPTGSAQELEFTDSDRVFTNSQSKTLGKEYKFEQWGTYAIKARIWNPDRSDMFDESEIQLEVKSPYDAKVADIWISPDPFYAGEATIKVKVENRSSSRGPYEGAATFDVRLEVDPPGSGITVHPLDLDDAWNDVHLAKYGTVTLERKYTFNQTSGSTRYGIKAEVYGSNAMERNWDSDLRLNRATREEEFSVESAPTPPDLAIEVANQVTMIAGHQSANPVHVTLTNSGGSVSNPIDVEFTFATDEGKIPAGQTFYYANSQLGSSLGELEISETPISVRAGETLNWYAHVSPPADLKAGAANLCAQIVEEPLKSHCEQVYVLPDLGADFTEEFTAYQYTDWLPAGFRLCIAGNCIPSTNRRDGSEYWILVPDDYPELNQNEHVASRIHSRAVGGYENREVRIAGYKELIKDIASQYYSFGDMVFVSGIEGAEQIQILGSSSGHMLEAFEFAAEHLLETHNLESAALNIEVGGVLHHHLEFASKKLPYAQYLLKGSKWGLDVFMTEAINRSIDIIEAEKALDVMERLALDPAWSVAVAEARQELRAMTGEDALARWLIAIDENFTGLVEIVAEIAIAVAIKKAAAGLISATAAAAGVSTAVVALPFTIAVGITIWAVIESIKETERFWDGWTHASLAGLIYAHLYDLRRKDSDWNDTSEKILNYSKFTFYQQLHSGATTKVVILGMDPRSFRFLAQPLFRSSQKAAAEVLDSNWNAVQTFSDLQDAKRPLDIWSDGTLMWVMDGQSRDDYSLYSFKMTDRKQSKARTFQYPNSGILGFIGNVVDDADPRGIWSKDGVLWVADHGGTRRIYKYNLMTGDLLEQFSLPSNLESLPDGGIWSDGTTMWFTSNSECGIAAYDIPSGVRDESNEVCDLADDNTDPFGIWVEGRTAWVSDIEDAKIYSYSLESGQRLVDNEFYTVNVPEFAVNLSPSGIWSDGETMWVADRESDMIFAYTLPDTLTAPQNLTATVSEIQVALNWQPPSNSGRFQITGYELQVSTDGESWESLPASLSAAASSFSDQISVEWNVRHYRVAAINLSGLGPWSATATVYQGLNIDSVSCSPERTFAGEPVECTPQVTTASTGELSYAWNVEDATLAADEESGSVSITWNSVGTKGILLVVCTHGDAADYLFTPWEPQTTRVVRVEVSSGGACAELSQMVQVVPVADGSDRSVLVELYLSTGGDNWSNNRNWNTETHIDDWVGVGTQDRIGGPVTSLLLDSNGLIGQIPSRLQNLTALVSLNLEYNELSGFLPPELGNLSELEYLQLNGNSLSGPIPDELGKLVNLKVLDLHYNELDGVSTGLTGKIPVAIGKLINLTQLILEENQLSGQIPAELGNLHNLVRLDLEENHLTGPIPDSLGRLSNLERLYLGDNHLTGQIPPSLANLNNLKSLDLRNNNLSGTIPVGLKNLPNLSALYLSGNDQLEGCVPTDLARIANNDLDEIGLDFCGSSLTSLAVSTGTLTPPFSSSQTSYSVWVRESQVTISATSDGAILFLSAGGRPLVDANNGISGHQVELTTGQTTVVVRATSGDGLGNLDYIVMLSRAAEAPSAPLINSVNASAVGLATGWNAPAATGSTEISAYHLRHIESVAPNKSDANWTAVDDVWQTGSSVLSYRLVGLRPGTQYDVQLRAENAAGAGPWSATATGTTETEIDRNVLLSLFNSTGGPTWRDNTGWLSNRPIGEWHGVSIGADGRVIELDLLANLLRGPIPTLLADLTSLRRLFLGRNELFGTIPSELGSLTNLTDISLRDNPLTGCVPEGLSYVPRNDFAELGLPFCDFRPISTGDQAVLVALYNATDGPNWSAQRRWLSSDPIGRWQGVIADANGNVTQLILGGYGLNGPIPAEIGSLRSLNRLILSNNRLTVLPPELGDLANLTHLDVSNSGLRGPIPEGLGNLPNLKMLRLSGNPLTGCVPDSLERVPDNDLAQLGLPFCDFRPISTGDQAVLVALYNATDGPNWSAQRRWLSSDPISRWQGVVADSNGDVTQLILGGYGLNGPIPAEIGSLRSLNRLTLSNNRLTVLPPELGDLANLTHLDVSNSGLRGPIPEGLGNLPNLKMLRLSGNPLTGCVPDSLERVPDNDLAQLGLPFCDFRPISTGDQAVLVALYNATDGPNWSAQRRWLSSDPIGRWQGVIADANGNVTQLILGGYGLNGPIPAEIGSLRSLNRLTLSNNRLTVLPPELGDLANLTHLDVSNSGLRGPIPEGLGNLPNLKMLRLSGNPLTGCVPDSLERVPDNDLAQLGLPFCKSGTTGTGDRDILVALYNATDGPNWRARRGWLSSDPIGRWQGVIADANGNVTQLILDGYGLNGRIPPELGNLRSLNRLILNNNTLGELPPELGNLSNLTLLNIAYSDLSGHLPPELGNLSNLVELNIHHSELSGPIPSELGNLSNLRRLTLNSNEFTGVIPPELGNLTNLALVRFYGNRLTGCVPGGLRRVANNDFTTLGLPFCDDDPAGDDQRDALVALYNATDGPNWTKQQGWMSASPIGDWQGVTTDANGFVTRLVLNSAGLNGPIPPELGNLTNLEDLVLEGNRLTSLPPEIGNLSNLTSVLMSSSELAGDIPPELGKLTNLRTLLLAHNRFTGDIPAELGNLTNLTYFRVIGNQLTGCVPAALQDVNDANDFATMGLHFCDDEPEDTGGDETGPDPTGPQNGDRVYLNGGTLNGQRIVSANPTLTIEAGQAISGTVALTVHKDHFAGAAFPVEATPTWGTPERSYWRVSLRVPAFSSSQGSASVNLTAPDTPGEYAIIFVAQAELSGGYVASGTHWGSGGPRWNNGDDVANWDDATIEFAIENGYVLAPQHGWGQANAHFGAAAIQVTVTAAEEDDEEGSNCLQDIICYTSSSVEHSEAAASIRQEFGEDWVVADWNDLKSLWSLHQEELKEFFPFGARVNVDGNAQWGSSGRWYFVEDHDGSKPGNFLAHDELGGNELSLGSWFFDEAHYLAIESSEEEEETDEEEGPDLVVESLSVDENSVDPEERFTLSATVRNQGNEESDATTLRYFRSTDSTISTTDTQLDTDDVRGLRPERTGDESLRMEAPTDAGTYYFGACVDSVTDESNTQNNCSDGVAVTVLGVDLVVQSASASESRVELSDSFELSATVRNQGEGESDSSTLRYYRSTDSTIDAGDTQLGTDNVSSLDPDETDSESETVYAPVTAGTYYYGACVDSVTGESDTLNNCSTGVEITAVEGDPELSVSLTRLSDNILGTGVSFTLTATVRNYGEGDAASTTLRYYRSTDSFISTSDTQVGGTDTVGGLAVEETEDHSESMTTPDSSGTYYYGACVETVPGESFAANDCSVGMAIGVGNVIPDLEVYSPSVYEKTFDPGQRFDMAFWIRNQGTGPSPTSQTAIHYYRSDDSTISSSDTELFENRQSGTGTINPSDERLIEYRTSANQSGTYYYGACIDVVARETVTDNNCAAVFKVTVN